jgi:hypothetical protein
MFEFYKTMRSLAKASSIITVKLVRVLQTCQNIEDLSITGKKD